MTVLKKLKIAALGGALAFVGLLAADRIVSPTPLGFVSTAQAIVGRPLTPVSVAGVARRTVRRCAVGVYYC